MFKLEKKSTFTWPVTVNVPKDGGTFASHQFTAEFKLQEQSKVDALLLRFQQNDEDILKELLVGWLGVQDSDGDELDYTEENKAKLLDIPYVRSALLKAYFEAASGNKVKRGN